MNRTDRRIIALAIPALGSLAVEPLYVLVDTAIVGRLGTAQLGGLAIAATVLGLVVAGCNFLTYGTTERVARRLGAGRPADAADVAVQTMWLSTLVGARRRPARRSWPRRSLAGLARRQRRRLRLRRHLPADHAPSACRSSCSPSAPRACSAAPPTTARRSSSCSPSNLVNAVLEVVFVFGFDWGVPGSAWSTVIAQVGAGVAFAVVVRRHLAPGPPSPPEPGGDGAAAQRRPLPAAARRLDARRDRPGRRRSPPASTPRRWPPTRSPPACCCSSPSSSTPWRSRPRRSSPRSSARGRRRRPPSSSRRCVRLSIITGAGAAVVLAALSPLLPDAFSADDAVTARATAALLWLAVMLVPAAIAFAYDGVLIGAGDYRFLGLAALAYLVAVAPIGAVVLRRPTAASAAIWAGLAVWMVLRAVVNHLRATRAAPPECPSGRGPRRRRPVRRLLVTGGTGYLGRVVAERAAAAGWKVLAFGSRDLDVRDRRRRSPPRSPRARPDAIVHTAYVRDGVAAWPVNVARQRGRRPRRGRRRVPGSSTSRPTSCSTAAPGGRTARTTRCRRSPTTDGRRPRPRHACWPWRPRPWSCARR